MAEKELFGSSGIRTKISYDLLQIAFRVGLAVGTLYNWISNGRMKRGVHYLKVGRKPIIIREKFIELMEEEDGSWETW